MSVSSVAALPQQRVRLAAFSRTALLAFISVGVLCAQSALAQDARYPWEDFDKRLQASQSVGALSSDLFGDQVGLQNGALSFEVTDASIPGNSGLAVAFTRRYEVMNHKSHNGADGMLGDWNVVVPNISASFAPDWETTGTPGNRCSDMQMPPVPDSDVSLTEFWHGIHIEIPSVGGGELLAYDANTNPKTMVPSDGAAYKWVTNGHIRVSCLPESASDNHTGEGFLAVAPDGTKYWFTQMAQYFEPTLKTLTVTPEKTYTNFYARRKNVLYATKVEDRFGNWVTYAYSNAWNAPGKLTGVQSSDGRSLTISYLNGVVTSVSGAGRTWDYSYVTTSDGRKSLDRVTLPNDSYWNYDFEVLTDAGIETWDWGENDRTCINLETPRNYDFEPVGTVTHPSGAVGTFTLFIKEHGRTNVPISCGHFTLPSNDPVDDVNIVAISANSFTLKQKRIDGPNVSEETWNYSYPGGRKSIYFPDSEGTRLKPICNEGAICSRPNPVCAPACPGSMATVVTGPNQEWTRYTYGNSYLYNEGKLLSVERGKIDATGTGTVTVFETTVNTYDFSQVDLSYLATSSQPEQIYPARFGDSRAPNRDGFATEFHRPQVAAVTTRQDVNFVWEANDDCGPGLNLFCFDVFANPTDVNKFSTLPGNPVRNEVTSFHNDLDDWVVGRVSKSTVNGTEVVETTYDTLALPITQQSFGKLQHTLSYDLASAVSTGQRGTLTTYKDGRNNVTTVSNWYRGVPRTIDYPGTAGVTATVNADGTIASVTNEVGARTCYSYQDGQLVQITHPSETQAGVCDTSAWNATTFEFSPSLTSVYGVAAGHWRQTVQTGNGVKVSYFDAMWRPVLTREYQVGNESATQRFNRFAYDHAGRTTFAAYPSTGSAATTGIETFYDALGRVTRVEQDAELDMNADGVVNEADELKTYTEYLSGFVTRVTNPRTYSTTTSYMAFDSPTTDWPVQILHPLNVATEISRDIFGKPTAITRKSADGTQTVTRSYAYNSAQELCRTGEPETGVTIMQYDAAGNVDWSASGLADTATCSSSIPAELQVDRTYDSQNRLTGLAFPDGNGSQTWSYTPDGLPSQVVTTNFVGIDPTTTTNAYSYNQRRLPTGESLTQSDPHYTWSIGYGYNANGHVASHTYPGGASVAYSPNALGQPTQAGSYATGVDYFPNGAVAQFTYGNGIVHQMTPNARQLPMRSLATYGGTEFLDDYYDYDANGNVAAISDGLTGSAQRGNRTMTYDALDRLTTADSPMFGGIASYDYDALDNLTHVVAPGRDHQYKYIDGTNRLTSVTDTVGGATVIGLDYDLQGNLSIKNGVEHDFDFGNRLREVEGKEHYRYDAHGRRIQATEIASGQGIFSFYGQDGVLRHQHDQRKGETVSYVYLAGSLLAEVADALAQPTSPVLSAVPLTSTDGNVSVSWNATGTGTYRLDESADGGATWIRRYDSTGTMWSASGKANGSYQYRVRACDIECSGYSNAVTVTVDRIPTDAPAITAPSATSLTTASFTVTWTSVAYATAYTLEQQYEAGAWEVVHSAAGTSKAVTVGASGTYRYRVSGCSSTCGPVSAVKNIEILLPPSVPSLTVPATSANGAYTVSWTSATGATEYVLHESPNGSTGWTTVYDNGTALSKAFSGRAPGPYYYKVQACNTAGCSASSTTDSVNVPPATPALTVPATGPDGTYTVSWTSQTGAARYVLQESPNGTTGWTTVYNTGTALSQAFSGKVPGTYHYRVRACNASCSAWSAIGNVDVPPSAPVLTVPATDADGSYTISWTSVATAVRYVVQESPNGSTNWVTVYDGSALSASFSDKAPGRYYYRVQACNAACGAWSSIADVRVPPTVPALTVPATDADGSYTISWTAETGATKYTLQESPNGSTGWVTVYNNGTALSMAFSGKAPGRYYYRVRACNAACSAWSAIASVNVQPAIPALTVPTYGLSGAYTISWTAETGATKYTLQESPNGSTGWATVYDSTALSMDFSAKPAGTYYYRVRACNATCSGWSANDSVQVIYKPDTPALTVPNEEVDGNFTVSWTSESGAARYELQENAIEVYDGTALSMSWTGHAAGTYTYRVRACNVAGCSAYSSEKTLLLAAPSAGSTLSVSGSPTIGNYTITGTLVERGYSYRLHESVNGGGWVWVHTQNWGLSKAFSKPGGTYAYRAWVCNTFGCGPYGATLTLTVKPVTAPTLTVPTSDDDGDYTISWTAVSGATSYRVQEFYELDDAWVTFPATSATSKAFADKLAGDYQYKAYACNSAGCGPTSATKLLTVLPPPPPPATPTGLYVEKLLFTNCAVSWNSVVNATNYQVQNGSGIRYDGSSTSYRESGCSGSYQVRACNASSCSAWSAGVYPSDPQ